MQVERSSAINHNSCCYYGVILYINKSIFIFFKFTTDPKSMLYELSSEREERDFQKALPLFVNFKKGEGFWGISRNPPTSLQNHFLIIFFSFP